MGLIRRFARERGWGGSTRPRTWPWRSVEAGEAAEILEHLADVYVYLLKRADCFGIDPLEATQRKMGKNALKYPVHKARGTAKKYSEP